MKKTLIYSALILLSLSISACGESKSNQPKSSEEEDPPIIDNSGFKNINDEEPFEIHTEAQKTFLEYDGSYAKMDKSLFPTGSDHLSDSLPITFTWKYELPEDKEVDHYSVIFGQKKDLSDGYKVEGDNQETISFNNPYLGKNYYQSYRPVGMMGINNDLYIFIDDNLDFFLENAERMQLKKAWQRYKEYVTESNTQYPFSMKNFKEELKNYYKEYAERRDGERKVYIGFIESKFQYEFGKEEEPDEEHSKYVIDFSQ